ncbi:ATP-binding protein [Micromonospora echinospora]|uniref:ATP-binding protein n=1 Tax=Micromonospora echinospora TaxID=1877 RepID=UPI0018D4E980|nr:ATP-binding protein [Micromonospora echinospora]
MTNPAAGYRIVSPELTVKAMRDNGYKNTAFALAELIDNSIDAEANLVEVFACEERPKPGQSHVRPRIETIAVLDDGKGMDGDTLRRALKFGDGRGGNSKRIGRFGMGLPNSSMSQCRKVEVWSWTNGAGNALYTYLWLDEIENGLDEVPEPVHQRVPDQWQQLSDGLGESGTLVVWSDLDRVLWYGAAATLRNTEELIGRVYRHYLKPPEEGTDHRSVDIRLVPVRDGDVIDGERFVSPNDPLYLTHPTCTPAPFADKPMFMPSDIGDEDNPGVVRLPITHNGQTHDVIVRASIARPEARQPNVSGHPWPANASPNTDAGTHPWGKHAARNIGVSLVRQGRELSLDTSWAIGYDPIERWWGVEVDFPRELDAAFGVTNNKQTATHFAELAHFDWKAEAEPGETFKALKDRLAERGDPRLPLIDLAFYLQEKLLPTMRRQIRQQRVGARKNNKRHEDEAAKKANDAINRRRDDGRLGQTDKLDQETEPEQKRQQQVDTLTNRHHIDKETAEALVDEDLAKDIRVRWISNFEDSPAFFSIDLMAGMLQVIFNSNHPLHRELMTVLEDVPDNADADALRERLSRAADTFKLLIFSWARMEDEIPGERQRAKIAEARQDWGRYARHFLDDGDDDE